MAAKAYRLLRAVLITAVDDDNFAPAQPVPHQRGWCGAASEGPVLTVQQVFDLAELVGRRPIGNTRKLPDGTYRLRVQRHGEMRAVPGTYRSRASAEAASGRWRAMAWLIGTPTGVIVR